MFEAETFKVGVELIVHRFGSCMQSEPLILTWTGLTIDGLLKLVVGCSSFNGYFAIELPEAI